MNYLKLKNIKKLYFGYEELARALNISIDSARVTASRYVNLGFLTRVKRNLYVLTDEWENFQDENFFQVANIIQTPSYVSLMSALCYYEISTQIQQKFVESIALNRTINLNTLGVEFSYFKIDKNMYFGFTRTEDYFIACPEKAFLDALYLKHLGNYDFDISSVNINKLSIGKMKKVLRKFPDRFINYCNKNECFSKTRTV